MKYRYLTIFTLMLIGVSVFLLANFPLLSSGQEPIPTSRVPSCGCYTCGKLLPVIFPNQAPRCAGILSEDACPEAVGEQNMSRDDLRIFCAELRGGLNAAGVATKCPVYATMCRGSEDCELYSGEITCDCNGDGKDDATKTFKACGTPSNFPRKFKSRCEEWATGDGGFSFSTDIRIQRAGSEWLTSIACLAMDCHQKFAKCTGPLETQLQKCLTGNRLLGMGRRCQEKYTAARTACEQARSACLNGTRRSGPAPLPQPLPTPTPSLSLGIFGQDHLLAMGFDIQNCR